MQTTKNLPESCKASGHCFRSIRKIDYKKTVQLRCSRCGEPQIKKARR